MIWLAHCHVSSQSLGNEGRTPKLASWLRTCVTSFFFGQPGKSLLSAIGALLLLLPVVKVVPEVGALFRQLLVFVVSLQLSEKRRSVLRCFDLVADVLHQPIEGILDDLLFVRDPFRGRPAEQLAAAWG